MPCLLRLSLLVGTSVLLANRDKEVKAPVILICSSWIFCPMTAEGRKGALDFSGCRAWDRPSVAQNWEWWKMLMSRTSQRDSPRLWAQERGSLVSWLHLLMWCWDREEEELSFSLNSTDYHCSYQDLVNFLKEVFLFLLCITLGKFPETLNVFEKIIFTSYYTGNRSMKILILPFWKSLS